MSGGHQGALRQARTLSNRLILVESAASVLRFMVAECNLGLHEDWGTNAKVPPRQATVLADA
jgi:hypothetical protein